MGWGGLVKVVGAWYEPEKNGRVMGLISISFQSGGGLAFIYCAYLVSLGYGWRELFIIPAITLFIIMIYTYLASKPSPNAVFKNVYFGGNESNRDSYKKPPNNKVKTREIIVDLIKQNSVKNLIIFSFLTTLLRTMFVFWTAKFLVDIGLENSNAILKSSIFPLLGVLGTVSLGWYTDLYSENGDRAIAMCVFLFGLVLSLFLIAMMIPYQEQYQNGIVLALGLSGFLYGPYAMTSGCLALDIAGPHKVGTFTGLLDGIGYIGGAIAAWELATYQTCLGGVRFFLHLIDYSNFFSYLII